MNAAAVGAVTSRYPQPAPLHIQEPDYIAILRTLSYQTRGIFERLRDLFDGRAYIQLSLDLIAGRIGCSRGLLIAVLRELEEIGLLKVYRQRIGPRRNEVNRYVLPDALLGPTVQQVNFPPRLAVHQEARRAITEVHQEDRQLSAEVHQVNFPRARESVRQMDGFLPSAASTESESERRRKEEVEDESSSATHPLDSFSKSENRLKVKVMTEAGIHPRNHKRLLAYPLADLQRAIALARENAEESFDGYIVTTLRQGFFEDEPGVPPPLSEVLSPVVAHVEATRSPLQVVARPERAEAAPQVVARAEVVEVAPQVVARAEVVEAAPQVVARAEVVEAAPQVVARAEVVEIVKPSGEGVTSIPTETQPPVPRHPQQAATPEPAPKRNLDDPRGEKAALFEGAGLKPAQYESCITYKLRDIEAAIQSGRQRQVKHIGLYALAILRKQPAPPHETIDYELLLNRDYEWPAAAPIDESRDTWLFCGKLALSSMGEKDRWRSVQDAYAGFDAEAKELLLRHDKLPIGDNFAQRFVERLQMVTWNYQEADKEKRFCVKVRLV